MYSQLYKNRVYDNNLPVNDIANITYPSARQRGTLSALTTS